MYSYKLVSARECLRVCVSVSADHGPMERVNVNKQSNRNTTNTQNYIDIQYNMSNAHIHKHTQGSSQPTGNS